MPSELPRQLGGFRIIESPYVPPGQVFLIDPSALSEPRLTSVPLDSTWGRETSIARYEMRMSFALQPTVEETDPYDWFRPRGVKGWLRRFRAIMGYEYRKAAGTLRRYPKASRSMGVITGIGS